MIGSSLNAGFISGSPRYNYGKTSWDIPRQYIEKRERGCALWQRSSVLISEPLLQLCGAGRRGGIDRRRAFLGASPCQCGVLGS